MYFKTFCQPILNMHSIIAYHHQYACQEENGNLHTFFEKIFEKGIILHTEKCVEKLGFQKFGRL